MPVVLGYSDYYIAAERLSIKAFVDRLSDEFINDWGKTFVKVPVEREDLIDILKNTGTQFVGVEDRKNEPERLRQMVAKYLEDTNTHPDAIDCIIYTRGNPVVGEVNIPYFLQKEFQINQALIFGIEQECSATLLAIKLGQALLHEGTARKVLIISRNIFDSFEKRLMGLFLVSDGFGLLELSEESSGLTPVDFVSTSNGNITKVQDFTLKAAEVVEVGVQLIRSVLDKNNLTVSDLTLIIPQNTNSSGWNIYMKQLGIVKEQLFLENFGGSGHLGDVDMIRNITDIRQQRRLIPNQLALAYALGTGTSWNALLLKMLGNVN